MDGRATVPWSRAAPAVLLGALIASAPAEAEALFKEHYSECHGADRLGRIGPALLPENLRRLRETGAAKVIAQGRAATQMPAFGEVLTPPQVQALVAHIFTPLPQMPRWDMAEIAASRIVTPAAASIPDKPRFDADPLNLFVVVESGDHHVTIMDGDTFEPIHRFPSRFALHGGPKFSPDGRFVYFASRDGWITKFDLWGLEMLAEVRAGINTRNLAISHDGKYVMVANYLPHTLVALDAADLKSLKVIAVTDFRGKQTSRVSAVYQARPRKSFIAALKDVPEVWEIPYGADAKPIYSGLVHSYEEGMEEALAKEAGPFPVRHIRIKEPLDDFFFDPAYRYLLGSARDGGRVVVVHMNVGREIAEIPLPGLPHLGSGIAWRHDGRRVMASPHLKESALSIIDIDRFEVVKRIPTLGPGFFLRSHENTDYAWADVFFGPHKDAIHVIDKRTLEIVKTLRPSPGQTAAHVEFTRDGAYALVSIWEMDGALVVFDAATFEEVKRIPMKKPSGKYNVFNKITFSAGTSH